MINESKNFVNGADVELESPYFDELASANAKPVQPIPTRGVGFWVQRGLMRAKHAREMVNGRTKMWALVLVAAVAMGSLGGTLLVQESNSSIVTPAVQESMVVKHSQDSTPETIADESTVADEISPAQVSAMALQRASKLTSKPRRHRAPRAVQGGQRAYRVAVIR